MCTFNWKCRHCSSIGTATTASNANLIAVVDESTDTTCSVLYSGSPTGYVAAKTGSNLTFDSVTGTLKPTNLNVTGISTVSIFNANAYLHLMPISECLVTMI